jgi:hypothetical protein
MCETQRLRLPLAEPRRGLGAIKGTVTLFLSSDHPTLPFGFEIGKVVKYAGFDPPEKPRASTHRGQTVRPENHGHHANLATKSLDVYDRLVPRKWIGVNEISAEEMKVAAKQVKTHD